jgi:hypothetical protein
MTQEEIIKLEKGQTGKIKVVFLLAFEATVNKPSVVPYGAWATVANKNEVIILKEARSKSAAYNKQDIGFYLMSSRYGQHYNVSNAQYDSLFGKDNWEKVWMEFDEFQDWKQDRKLKTDKDADKRQDASWSSTGHR